MRDRNRPAPPTYLPNRFARSFHSLAHPSHADPVRCSLASTERERAPTAVETEGMPKPDG
ncbi:hypothetical protein MUK72_01760 [Halococcus dombrowskii]|uniref:Uncharacterized protein n=1 Tax=Halococcus dombrowskii TaxID=179637 RepID=A0AAX3AMI4_HALDO|nr:hypothetical protein [Halococcus dombrowskii]UOO95448.1 hypothetical protein MUK72_01760 [Halococcus dombrowskii]